MSIRRVLTDGKYLGERSYYNFFVNLYLLDDSFYEVWYFRDGNEIEKIEKLVDEKTINLYIDFNCKASLK